MTGAREIAMNEYTERMPPMAPNRLSPVDNRVAATVRPEFKIAARTTQDGRVAPIEKAELLTEITHRQSVIDGLQAELLMERDKLKSMRKQLATEVAARVRSESERDEAQRECQRLLSLTETEMERLRAESDAQKVELSLAWQQIDVVMAERSKLVAAFKLLQREMSAGTGEPPEIADAGRDGTMRTASLQEGSIEKSSCVAPALAGVGAPAVVDTQVELGEAHPEIVQDIKQVLEQVKGMYDLDLNSGRSSMELVDSLTARLRQARDIVVARSSVSERDVFALFEQQIDAMMDSSGGSSFGRHLSISAYAVIEPTASTQRESTK
jgi:hypothetical protein